MTETSPSPKRRRWFRISLRTFLVLFTVGCVALGRWIYRAEQQRKAVEWVKLNGGFVVYDYEISDLFLPSEQIESDGIDESGARKWLRSVLGDDYIASVTYVSLNDSDISDISPLADLPELKRLSLLQIQVEDLSPLSGLSELQELNLARTQITDLTPLSNLTNLKQLRLPGNSQLQDLSPLSDLTDLRELDLTQTPVTDLTALSHLTNLKEVSLSENLGLRDISALSALKGLVILDISNTQVNDLRPLTSLHNLQSVYLGWTSIPQEQIDALIDRNVEVSYTSVFPPKAIKSDGSRLSPRNRKAHAPHQQGCCRHRPAGYCYSVLGWKTTPAHLTAV